MGVTAEEKLVRTRNVIRWLIRKMYDELDEKIRVNSRFFFDLMKKLKDIDVVIEDEGRFILTGKEQEAWHRSKPRHRASR